MQNCMNLMRFFCWKGLELSLDSHWILLTLKMQRFKTATCATWTFVDYVCFHLKLTETAFLSTVIAAAGFFWWRELQWPLLPSPLPVTAFFFFACHQIWCFLARSVCLSLIPGLWLWLRLPHGQPRCLFLFFLKMTLGKWVFIVSYRKSFWKQVGSK